MGAAHSNETYHRLRHYRLPDFEGFIFSGIQMRSSSCLNDLSGACGLKASFHTWNDCEGAIWLVILRLCQVSSTLQLAEGVWIFKLTNSQDFGLPKPALVSHCVATKRLKCLPAHVMELLPWHARCQLGKVMAVSCWMNWSQSLAVMRKGAGRPGAPVRNPLRTKCRHLRHSMWLTSWSPARCHAGRTKRWGFSRRAASWWCWRFWTLRNAKKCCRLASNLLKKS